jgi:hypothetical protein
MWDTREGMWAIQYNGRYPWLHNRTIRRTRHDAIKAIVQDVGVVWGMQWNQLKKYLNLSVVRVKIVKVETNSKIST